MSLEEVVIGSPSLHVITRDEGVRQEQAMSLHSWRKVDGIWYHAGVRADSLSLLAEISQARFPLQRRYFSDARYCVASDRYPIGSHSDSVLSLFRLYRANGVLPEDLRDRFRRGQGIIYRSGDHPFGFNGQVVGKSYERILRVGRPRKGSFLLDQSI